MNLLGCGSLLLFLTVSIVKADGLNDQICETEECKRTAVLIESSIDKSVNPCDDYFQYACGNFVKQHPIKNGAGTSNLAKLGADTYKNIIKLLDQSSTAKEDKLFHPLINLYKGCSNDTKRELNKRRDFGLINDLIKRTVGGWPLIDSHWNETEFDIEKAIIESIKLLYTSSFLNIRVIQDLRNNTKPIITLSSETYPNIGLSGVIGFPEQDNIGNMKQGEYYALAMTSTQKVAVEVVAESLKGSNVPDTLLIKEMNEVKNAVFDQYSKVGTGGTLRLNYDKFKVKVKNISEIKGLNYRRILDEVLETENITIGDNDDIFADIEYLKSLATNIHKFPKRVIANKMATDLAMSLISLTSHMLWTQSTIWKNAARPNALSCFATVMQELPDLLGRFYYEKVFEKDSIEDMKAFIASLKEAFHQMLEQNKWMDETTRRLAITKLNAITANIAFPDITFNLTQLQDKYKPFKDFNENTYLTNTLRVLSNKKSNNLKAYTDLGKGKGQWTYPINPVVVNAYYNPRDNGIYFPSAIAQFPTYQHTRPKSVNYGGIGMIIGHEMTHAFDNIGSRFDAKGNLNDWITDESKKIFDTKGQCFVDQYKHINYTIAGKHVNINGLKTLGENMGDHGGILIAYKAMEIYRKKHGGQIPKLPGSLSNYTDEKLFFSSFASTWCSHQSDQYLAKQLVLDAHSPEDTRVKATLANIPEFAKAYNCPLGSRMNPKSKCSLWE